MESVAAFGLACNIIQVVEFASKLVSRTHDCYNSIGGRIPQHAILNDAAVNLADLYSNLLIERETHTMKSTVADKQLINLQNKTEKAVKSLQQALENVRLKGDPTKWNSIYHALKSVLKDREISYLGSQLDTIRAEVDTVLLFSLRERIDDSTKTLERYPGFNTSNAEQKHQELLNAVRENNALSFSTQLQFHTNLDLQEKFGQLILARLYFQHMPDRLESIPQAHEKTFSWIFSNQFQNDTSLIWDNFPEWLAQEDSDIYWITGKPGSGKSTLMKYLYGHPELATLSSIWGKGADLITAGFYLWNSGSGMQMSRLGLFRSLLHTCLKERKDSILSVFPERWEQFLAYGGGRESFEWAELQRGFKHMVSDQSRKFLFLIDGLDEFDGEPKEIIDLIIDTAGPNVKMCVASRPWLPFEDAFQHKPNLLLERLTHQDIMHYVYGHFHEHEHYKQLRIVEPAADSVLLSNIVSKAQGVFLWVHLVVQSLLEGLSNSDSMSDLQSRLDSLPSDLRALFNKLLDRLQPQYFKRACETFRLLRTYRECFQSDTIDQVPTLLGLWYADDQDTKSSLSAKIEAFQDSVTVMRTEAMRRRLNARCKGLLEVKTYTKEPNSDPSISYLHRTARDFVESEAYWPLVMDTTGHASFKPLERWANASLWIQKIHPYVSSDGAYYKACIIATELIQKNTGIVPKTYIDEFIKCRETHHSEAHNRRPIYRTQLARKLLRSEYIPQFTQYVNLTLQMSDKQSRTNVLEDKQFLEGLVYSLTGDAALALEHYLADMRPSKRRRWLRIGPKLPPLPALPPWE